MTMHLGWYVHHHGRGHLTRMRAIAAHLDADITCFSTLPAPPGLPTRCAWIRLQRDDEPLADDSSPAERDPSARGLLHWAPLGHQGHRDRLAVIASTLSTDGIDAMVVDVSVEVTLLARLLGVRTVVLAQPGVRTDAAHQLGFRAATAIIAPWPQRLLRPAHLEEVGDRVVYVGGISRFDGRERPRAAERSGVVVLGGAGGSAVTEDEVASAAAASGRPWTTLGATPGAAWSADPWSRLCSAAVVVSWAGQNAIADLAAAGARAVVIPQSRPFEEQDATARVLDASGLAIVRSDWPAADGWAATLDEASSLEPDWSLWEVRGAAERAAAAIMSAASGHLR
ncbi:MAG TPA: glycosyltransferase [Plantibacter sp.]|uniref:glycosyltransferase n=1 Tax=unclassified Plantibacter TaxID=2624265 RepID=UPI002C95E463|nr:glycosyltransferase [Plantibacter sp.]